MTGAVPSDHQEGRASRVPTGRPAAGSAGAAPAIDARGVSRRFGAHQALAGVDLVVRPGTLHGLLGPNGAGKTTLLRILLGLIPADGGTVRMLGEEARPLTAPLPADVAGFVEMPAFYPYLSGRRNLSILARLDGLGAADRRPRIDSLLSDVGLSSAADRNVSGYSAGMRQRLGLAAALLRSPRLLLLDEPTSTLDPAGARDVRLQCRRLIDDGVTVLLSSHDMAEVEELCEELTVIDGGRVVFAGTVDELRRRSPAPLHALRTSDDGAALDIAAARGGVQARRSGDDGLEVAAEAAALDGYVIALAHAGVAVRRLEHRPRSLESLFLELTAGGGTAATAADPGAPHSGSSYVLS